MAVCLPGRRMLLRFVQRLSDIQRGCVCELLGGESRRSGGQEARRLCEQDGEPGSSPSSAPGPLLPRACTSGPKAMLSTWGRGTPPPGRTGQEGRDADTEEKPLGDGDGAEAGVWRPQPGTPRGPQTLPPPPEPPPPGGVRPCPPWSALWSQSWWRTHSCCPRCPGGSVASGLVLPAPAPGCLSCLPCLLC
ncbi:basic proline-rich protein-like [Leopardus geoffroyi]|uniref:basic proline-rich protein-like n=1 Tax=Leopardus geoffroyi TaxID=46844 RepID=UPI001E25FE95|nr:basic proline-rich protein-like [Leopardus geoffroyi]